MEPLVTIGIPVYNEVNFVAQTIESVLSQTHKNFILLISDNCSTDGSKEVLRNYALKDSVFT